MASDGEVLKWKQKCQTAENQLGSLKKLSHKAISDYEDLKTKYDDNVKAFQELKQRYEEQQSQLNTLPNVLETVVAEYDDIKTKYELETDLRNEAESYASQIHKQNVKLKRQSAALIQKVGNMVSFDIDIDTVTEENEDDSTVDKKQLDHLNSIIKDLENQVSNLRIGLRRADTDKEVAEKVATDAKQRYEGEHRKNEQSKYAMEYYEKTLKQLERASVLLVQDYDHLVNQVEQEKVLQTKAEEYASKMLQEKETMKRQSSALLASAATSERLMTSMNEIETLTRQLESEKHEYEKQIQILKEQLENASELEKISSMEQQLSLSSTEIEMLQKRVGDAEKKIKKLEKENLELEEKLKGPPPPPPPPPPPLSGAIKTLSQALGKKKKMTKERILARAKADGADPNASMGKAVEEMMERIRRGTALKRRVSVESKPRELAEKESPAMGEVQNILQSLKAKRGMTIASSNPASAAGDGVENQLVKILSSRRMKTDSSAAVTDDKINKNSENLGDTELSRVLSSRKEKTEPPQPAKRSGPKKLSFIKENSTESDVVYSNPDENEVLYEEVKG